MADTDIFEGASTIGENQMFVISHDFRTIDIPLNKTLAGVESDDDVNTVWFTCDRYYEQVDLSTFEFRIKYMNANGDGDLFIVTDKTVANDQITFSWTIGRNALAYAGSLQFAVCARIANQQGVIMKEYNTTINSLTVADGLDVDTEAIHQHNYDVIEQFIQTIEGASNIADRAEAAAQSVTTAVSDATTAATNASNSASAASDSATAASDSATSASASATAASQSATAAGNAQAAAEAVLNNIPLDYTQLSNDVTALNSAITQLDNVLDSLEDETYDVTISSNWQQGYRHGQGGTVKVDSGYIVTKSPVSFKKDDVLETQSAYRYYLVLADGSYYYNTYIGDTNFPDGFTFTEDANAYLEVKYKNGGNLSPADNVSITVERLSPLHDTLQTLDELGDKIDGVLDTPYSPSRVSASDLTINGLIDKTTGEFTADTTAGHLCTDFIPLEQNVMYILESKVNGEDALPRASVVYDYDKTYSRYFAAGSTTKWVTLTGNEKYVRFNFNTTGTIDIKLYPVFEGYTDIPVIKEDVIIPQIKLINTATLIKHRRPIVSFTLDGDYDLNEDFVELFETYGIRLGLAIGYPDFGTNNSLETYLDWCNNRGHEMLAYGVTPLPEDSTKTLAEADAIIRAAKYELVSRGFTIYGFVGSTGAVAERYWPSVKKLYEYGATKANVVTTGEACQYFETDDPCETWRFGLQAHTLAEMKDAVDHAESTGGLLNFYTHAETANIGYSTLANVEALIQYINSKNIEIMTPHEAFADYYIVRREDVITS